MTITNTNNLGFDFESPAYRFGSLETQANNSLCVPIVYGQARAAGNKIWQSSGADTFTALVCFAEGEINGFSDIRINNILIDDSALKGCSYTSYVGNGTQSIDSRVPGDTQTAKAELVGGLKHTAYLALSITAGTKVANNYMDVSAVLKGKSVRIYSSTTTYTTAYSNNPIWCILDFLTCENGCGLSHDDIDMQTFIDSATYCDAQIPPENEKRYTLNLILDTRKTRQDWLNEMLITCRGFLVYRGNKIGVIIEKNESSVQSFTQDDIIADSEVFWTTPKEQRADIFKVRYLDPDNQYARAYAVAEADEFLSDPPVTQEIVCLGITNFKQASRLAWFYLNQANTCDKFMSFNTTKKGLDRTPGDIIDITSTFMGYENKKLVVVSMNEAQEGQIQLICREYNSNLYNDTLGSVAPVINAVNLDDILSSPDDVQNLSVAQYLNSIIINWQPVSNSQAKYEIREGNSWSNSRVVATNLTGSSYTILNIQKGTFKYWIKAVNYYGNYSYNAALSTILVSDIQEINTIVHENILDEDIASGTLVNCFATINKIILNSTDTWSSSGIWDNISKNYAPYGFWGASCESTGSYTTKVYDIGANLDSIIAVNYDLCSNDDANNILIEWKYSEDNITWSDWVIFAQGVKTFRYYQFKITLNSPNNNYAALSNFIVNVDVPDRDMYFKNQEITVANNGVTVSFDPVYSNIPAVVANISDGTNGYCVISSKSASQATIKAYNNSGTAITAKVDIRVKGY